MSSISGLGGSMSDLLAALRQQLLGTADPNAALGPIDADGDNDGSGGSQTPAKTAVNAAPPLTGSASGPFDSTLLNLMINLQEQQGASGTSDGSQPPAPQLTPREQQLFAKLDTNGDGTISQSELEAAVTAAGGNNATADALFAKLDGNGDGSISTSEFAAAAPGHHHGGGMGGMGGAGGEGGMAQALSAVAGDTTSTVNNPDGSTTTTITYADGTSLTLTSPAAQTQGGDGASSDASGNPGANGASPSPPGPEALIEKLIKLEAEMIQAMGGTTPPSA